MRVQFLASPPDLESTSEEQSRSTELSTNISRNNESGYAIPLTQEELVDSYDSFEAKTSSHALCWILTKQVDKAKVMFRSTTFCSTLDSGWIPYHPIELVNLLVVDLQKQWTDICEAAKSHLEKTVCSPLETIVMFLWQKLLGRG
jgi:hypothetical protein